MNKRNSGMAFFIFTCLIIFSQNRSAWGGWLNPLDAPRLLNETISGKKDHITNGVQDIGKQTGVLKQYEIVITNQTDRALNYIFDGQPSLIAAYGTISWTVKNTSNTIQIKFDNGHNQEVRYSIGGGRYIFNWQNGVLDLFNE